METLQMALLLIAVYVSSAYAISVTSTQTWNITTDPQGSVRLNGLAFQQQPLLTFGDYQYIAYYTTAKGYGSHYVHLGRRRITPSVSAWEDFAFTDYEQKTLDEHNTISMGISGDGKIHLSFDHHDVPLNYRVSTSGVAKTIPTQWTQATFGGSVVHALPGSTGPWTPLTYPRFEKLANGDLLMEFRIGQSGAGDSYIHRYSASSGSWSAVGKYLQGQDNNAYINGITSQDGKLHVSWTVRETPDASTNHDFYYALSEDDGKTWKNAAGQAVSKPILPTTNGIKVYTIPQKSEIINQEAQCADSKGRFHALMRDKSSGTAKFYHYMRTSSGTFSKTAIDVAVSTPPYLAYRGKIASVGDNLIAIIPDQPKSTITIWGATAPGNFIDWKSLATIPNMNCEPGVDYERLTTSAASGSPVLSLFTRQGGDFGNRKVQIWDFALSL